LRGVVASPLPGRFCEFLTALEAVEKPAPKKPEKRVH
jgi:hypothetical protein